MNDVGGYVRIFRSLIGNPQFRGKDDEYAAIWLISKVVWTPTKWRVGTDDVSLDRGQGAWSISYLAGAWDCSKSTAYERLMRFRDMGFVRTQVRTLGRTRYTLITVCKYDDFQFPVDVAERAAERSPNESKEYKETTLRDARSVKAVIFDEGLTWIAQKTGKQANGLRGLVGRWIKAHGDEAVLAAIVAAQKVDPVEPVAWIEGRFKGQGGGDVFKAPPAWADKYRVGV